MFRAGNDQKAFIGRAAPPFTLTGVVNGDFQTVSLSDYKGKYLLFFFYPADFTFVCPTEIIAFSDRYEEFKAIDCEVLGVSTDSKFSHFAWLSTPRRSGGLGELNFPLLSDSTMQISRVYGVLFEEEGIACRGQFIIDGKGIIRQITINDLPIGRSVDEALRLVKALQYTDIHGEVCPANWHPGMKTMKPNMKESKKYFAEMEKDARKT